MINATMKGSALEPPGNQWNHSGTNAPPFMLSPINSKPPSEWLILAKKFQNRPCHNSVKPQQAETGISA
jgi:hypothetical protein